MPRSRLTIALYLILVFASGILVGVVSHRLYATTSIASANNSPQTVAEFRRRYLEGMKKEVGASEAQLVEIGKILEDTKEKVDELAAAEKPLHDKIQQLGHLGKRLLGLCLGRLRHRVSAEQRKMTVVSKTWRFLDGP